MNRINVLIVVVALLGGAAGFFVGRDAMQAKVRPLPPGVARSDVASIGDRVPALVFTDLDGREQGFDAWRGRPLLVNFWATWCGPCVQEMPALDAYHRAQGDDGVVVVGIALDDPEAVRAFLARHGVGYPIVLDVPGPNDASTRLGDTRGVLPYSVAVDTSGRIVANHFGAMDDAQIAELGQKALNPP